MFCARCVEPHTTFLQTRWNSQLWNTKSSLAEVFWCSLLSLNYLGSSALPYRALIPLVHEKPQPRQDKGFPEELQPDSLNPWQTPQARGTASSPYTEVLCPSVQALPQAQSWLQEPLGPRRQHWQAQAPAKVQQQPHTALKPLPELLTQSRNSMLHFPFCWKSQHLIQICCPDMHKWGQGTTWLAISAPAASSP